MERDSHQGPESHADPKTHAREERNPDRRGFRVKIPLGFVFSQRHEK
jgi:hypothetical protein